jgi:hypothetical protein
MRDDCDPRDPGWIPTSGCNRAEGDVNLAEFNILTRSSERRTIRTQLE